MSQGVDIDDVQNFEHRRPITVQIIEPGSYELDSSRVATDLVPWSAKPCLFGRDSDAKSLKCNSGIPDRRVTFRCVGWSTSAGRALRHIGMRLIDKTHKSASE